MKRGLLLLAILGVALLVPAAQSAVGVDSSSLRNGVTLAGIRAHQQALQSIANANGGTRLAGTAGYDESADYVENTLEAAGYTVQRQSFDFPFFQILSPTTFSQVSPVATSYVDQVDFSTMDFSGSGSVVAAEVVPTNDIVIPPGPTASTSNSGCEPADFVPASATEDQVALIQRGTCTFQLKAENAEAAGYDAVLVFNEGQQPDRFGLLFGTLGTPTVSIPVLGISFTQGEDFYEAIQDDVTVTVSISTDTLSELRPTENVIAETAGGRSDRVVVVGAHLDSVAEGPGINDNGSGSATLLEIAEQLKALNITPRNKVRFAWWGAEEEGLLGSTHYVSQLSAQDIKNIAVNLNFDMLGSPNFVRFVYDGDGSATPLAGPNGSGVIEDVFLDYFAGAGLPTEPTAFDGRSDYGPFIDVGIPAGGLFSGAEELKTPAQVSIFGGTAGEQLDPCYHEACDTFANNSDPALDQLSDGAAHAVLTFAMTTSAVNGTDKGKGKGQFSEFEFKGSLAQR